MTTKTTRLTVALALILGITAALTSNAHAIPPTHNITIGNGYNATTSIYGVEVVDYWWEETRYIDQNAFGSNGQMDNWSSFEKITDHAGRQQAAYSLAMSPNNSLPFVNLCHYASGNTNCLGPITLTQPQVWVYMAWGWFGTTPHLWIYRYPNNTWSWNIANHNN